jgi:hypothetical protein
MGKQTAFDSTVASVSQQFATVLAAPVPFLLVVGIVGIVIWRFLSHHYSGRLSAKDDLLTLRQAQLDDYKEKLSGASPDEAKARLDALEQRIEDGFKALAPRTLSDDQRQKLVEILDGLNGNHVIISQDAAVADARPLAQSIAAAFLAARWTASTPMVMGLGNPPPSGIGIKVPDQNNLSPPQRAIYDAFKAAGIPFDIQNGGAGINGPGRPVSVAEIVVTSRLA